MKRWMSVAFGLILIGIGGAALYGFVLDKPSDLQEYSREWKFADGDLRDLSLKLDAQSSSVSFVRSENGANTIRLEGKVAEKAANRLDEAAIENGKLSLDFNEPDHWLSFDLGGWRAIKTTETVTVSLTDAAAASLASLRVSSDAGAVTVSGSAPDTMDLSADAGSIHVSDYTGEKLTMSADAGRIRAENVVADVEASADAGSIVIEHLKGKADLQTDAGSVQLVKDDTSSAAIETDAGSVRVQLPKTFAGTYDLKNDVGKIEAPESKGETSDVIKVRTDVGSIKIIEE